MQTLHQELELSPDIQRLEPHPSLRGLIADQATAYAEEVRVLRQRVASLESALAAATVVHAVPATPTHAQPPLTAIDLAPGTDQVAMQRSEFVEQTTPAVAAITPSTQPQPPMQAPVTEPAIPTDAVLEPAPTPGFAQAWTADAATASFEERVAERAFFQASTVDQESRTWLLDH